MVAENGYCMVAEIRSYIAARELTALISDTFHGLYELDLKMRPNANEIHTEKCNLYDIAS